MTKFKVFLVIALSLAIVAPAYGLEELTARKRTLEYRATPPVQHVTIFDNKVVPSVATDNGAGAPEYIVYSSGFPVKNLEFADSSSSNVATIALTLAYANTATTGNTAPVTVTYEVGPTKTGPWTHRRVAPNKLGMFGQAINLGAGIQPYNVTYENWKGQNPNTTYFAGPYKITSTFNTEFSITPTGYLRFKVQNGSSSYPANIDLLAAGK